MSEPVDQTRGGPDAGAGQFWERYVVAGNGRERSRGGAEDDRPSKPDGSQGSASPAEQGTAAQHDCLDWCPICRGAEMLRSGAAPELRGQLHSVQRDSLLMLRALIDTYLQRTSPGTGAESDGADARERGEGDPPR